MEGLISIDRTAEVLGVSPWTIRAWVAQGKLKSVKLGSRRLVPESEVSRVMAEGIKSSTTSHSGQSHSDSSGT